MNYSFAADKEKLDDIVSLISDGADKIKEYQEQIYSIINSMGTEGIWSGETYDSFKAQCESYKAAIEGLYFLLLAFKLHFTKLANGASDLSRDISTIISS